MPLYEGRTVREAVRNALRGTKQQNLPEINLPQWPVGSYNGPTCDELENGRQRYIQEIRTLVSDLNQLKRDMDRNGIEQLQDSALVVVQVGAIAAYAIGLGEASVALESIPAIVAAAGQASRGRLVREAFTAAGAGVSIGSLPHQLNHLNEESAEYRRMRQEYDRIFRRVQFLSDQLEDYTQRFEDNNCIVGLLRGVE